MARAHARGGGWAAGDNNDNNTATATERPPGPALFRRCSIVVAPAAEAAFAPGRGGFSRHPRHPSATTVNGAPVVDGPERTRAILLEGKKNGTLEHEAWANYGEIFPVRPGIIIFAGNKQIKQFKRTKYHDILAKYSNDVLTIFFFLR